MRSGDDHSDGLPHKLFVIFISHRRIFQFTYLAFTPAYRINLATHCLLYGYQMKKEQIDEEIVRIAAEEIGLLPAGGTLGTTG